MRSTPSSFPVPLDRSGAEACHASLGDRIALLVRKRRKVSRFRTCRNVPGSQPKLLCHSPNLHRFIHSATGGYTIDVRSIKLATWKNQMRLSSRESAVAGVSKEELRSRGLAECARRMSSKHCSRLTSKSSVAGEFVRLASHEIALQDR